jgi:tetratricopeptide (TPR) repeat protein
MSLQESRLLRDDIFYPNPPWPQPIQEILDTCRKPESNSFYHGQMLYAVGAVLRSLVGFLASFYLYDSSFDNSKLNSLIAADLRRPTYGNLLSFLRACSATQNIEWRELSGLVSALKRALKIKHDGLIGVPRGTNILDALIKYRNSIVHGGRVLADHECQARIPQLEHSISTLLFALRVLCDYILEIDGEPRLHIGQTVIPLFPLVYEDTYPVLGIMEGYDTDHRRIRFVCVHKEWETEAPWPTWAGLLQRRGLLALDWQEIDEAWLHIRADALLPLRYRLPSGFDLSSQVKDDILRCVEPDGTLPAHDPGFAIAALYQALSDRIAFALEPSDRVWMMEPLEGLSRLIGASQSLSDLPETHPLNALIGKVTLIIPDAGEPLTWANWRNLESDFNGLKVIKTQGVGQDQLGYRNPENLLPLIFDNVAAENGVPLSWADLSAEVQRWIDGFEKVGFIISNPHLAKHREIDPVRIWREFLSELLPRATSAGLVEQLSMTCQATSSAPEKRLGQLLADAGCWRASPDGSWTFINEWARAAVFGLALGLSKGRQQRRLANNPPAPLSRELCREVERVCRATRYQPPLDSQGGQAILALSALDGKLPALPEDISNVEFNAVLESCRILVSWGRPDAVDDLINLIWRARGQNPFNADERSLAIASAVRRHGSPALAEKLFSLLATSKSLHAQRAGHELAGILRDRGVGDDRERAARLYAEMLADDKLSLEQRVRSLCGAAENQAWLENFETASDLLQEALALVPQAQPRLRAIVLHRLATVCIHEGAGQEALEAASEAVKLLGGRYQGAFAARCLDLYSLALFRHGDYKEAETALDISLKIKRATGDRLGLQKGLLQLSLIREKLGLAEAATPALEALRLAEHSKDLLGQRFLHRRLATLFRNNDAKQAHHLNRVEELTQMLERKGAKEDENDVERA